MDSDMVRCDCYYVPVMIWRSLTVHSPLEFNGGTLSENRCGSSGYANVLDKGFSRRFSSFPAHGREIIMERSGHGLIDKISNYIRLGISVRRSVCCPPFALNGRRWMT